MASRLEFYYSYLTSDPLGFVLYAVYFTVTVLLSLILHEISHGYMALRCGDPTAKLYGRLSLDPRRHLDPWGTVFMFLFGIGWAKPVPVNPRNYRNGRRDDILVSVAGICTNLTLFILSCGLSVLVTRIMWEEGFLHIFRQQYGSLQGLVNIYTPGEAGSWATVLAYGTTDGLSYMMEYARFPWMIYLQRFLMMMAQINLSLAVFNLIPIPPLDGWHLLNDTVLKGRLRLNPNAFRVIQLLLVAACLTGMLSKGLSTVNRAVYDAVANLFLIPLGGV